MKNKYPGICYHCKKNVETGKGHFERSMGKWRTIHADCVFIQRKEKQSIKEATL